MWFCHSHTHTGSYNTKTTLLHVAAAFGHMTLVQYIISDHNCDPLVRDIYGNTPLHQAARVGKLPIVKYFIEELECNPNIRGKYKMAPIHYSSITGHIDVIKYLIHATATYILVINSKQTPYILPPSTVI